MEERRERKITTQSEQINERRKNNKEITMRREQRDENKDNNDERREKRKEKREKRTEMI